MFRASAGTDAKPSLKMDKYAKKATAAPAHQGSRISWYMILAEAYVVPEKAVVGLFRRLFKQSHAFREPEEGALPRHLRVECACLL